MDSNKNPAASLIITTKNEGHNLKQTIEHIEISKVNTSYEIIVVDDGSSDHSTNFLSNSPKSNVKLIRTEGIGPAAARNLGVDAAQSEILVFLDAHIIPVKNWLDILLSCFEDLSITAISPVIGGFNPSHPDVYGLVLDDKFQPRWVTKPVDSFSTVPLAGSCGLTIRKQTFQEVEGFDESLRIMGLEDIDLCMRLWMLGYNIYVTPEVRILHKFRHAKPYLVLEENIVYNYLRIAFKLFNEERIARVINITKTNNNFGRVMVDVIASDVWEQRQKLNQKCKYNDDWFFSFFNMNYL